MEFLWWVRQVCDIISEEDDATCYTAREILDLLKNRFGAISFEAVVVLDFSFSDYVES